MNLITREIFGGTNKRWNTFIGGVSATISTSAQLATKLGISNNRIRNFVVVGSDIKCRIIGNYPISVGYLGFPLGITYYKDLAGLATTTGYIRGYANLHTWETKNATPDNYFGRECPLLTVADFPNVEHFTENSSFYESNCTTYNLNSALTLGSTVGLNQVFYGIPTGSTINVPIALSTVNAGGVEGDLAYAIDSRGATVNYI